MATAVPTNTTTTSTLSDWAGPYVTNMLGQTQALAGEGYQQYQGPLTAGASNLQQQAFQGIGSLASNPQTPANYNSTQFSSFLPGTDASNPYGIQSLQGYMNPYVQSVLDPQIREAQRAAMIAQNQNADRFAKAGAYGGTRQAVMDAELQRNLLQQVGDMTGKAYSGAFDNAQNQQYKAAQLGMDAQKATEQSKQFGAGYGLDALKSQSGVLQQLLQAGGTQRDIEQQGINADYGEFMKQVEHPYDQLKFMREMITGMPISTQSNTSQGGTSAQQWAGLISALGELYNS